MNTILPFTLEAQQGHLQCWAAIAISLGRFYQRPLVPTQQEFAHQVLGANCDQVCPPLQAMRHMQLEYQEREGMLTLRQLKAQLQAGHPLLAAMRYFIGWHLVVIYGVDEEEQVWLADPLYGLHCLPYEQLQQSYLQHYQWSHSYLFVRHLEPLTSSTGLN
ncbi:MULTISPECIES: papain-like cysteine protease family protein [unclassified Brenneria]|uniref:papain-like cysteine protease family protein n=1 Tax=unclassified Brenneria TaxID=2634434 RepID=UPI0015546A1A|nr:MULTISPECIES: papain-like cysteine protease family protein [unclassified Brenneria]MBJ7221962.1 hypothetical protein [Brenneria sp. L3-3C-1]MEE3643205.1 papain-like cysteine protease family protein [Brenneria sp. L3_3C_1]MEE3650608.1 papain-like cysteine protease family protein [Brenneria sp. HEZEL_4_2_4]NPD00563.1 hypothetical protein [Brenneria sp. hezel4-2-4]